MNAEEQRSAPPPLPAYIDSSMINTFRSCRRKFYWSYIRNLRSPGKSIHLVAGGAIAEAVDRARTYWFTAASPTYSGMIEEAFRGFVKKWGDYEAPADHAKSFVNCFSAVEQYLIQHHPAKDEVQPFRKGDGSPTTEFSFSIPLPVLHPTTGDPIVYVGRFDMLGKWGDLLTVLDEKSASALGASWVKQWKMRGQFLGYCWACQQLGYPVNQAVVRGIGLLKTQTTFLTAIEQYPQWMIDRWYEELIKTVNELVAVYQTEHWTYNFGDACTAYSGCSYQDLCIAREPEEWTSTYEVEVWNPLSTDND